MYSDIVKCVVMRYWQLACFHRRMEINIEQYSTNADIMHTKYQMRTIWAIHFWHVYLFIKLCIQYETCFNFIATQRSVVAYIFIIGVGHHWFGWWLPSYTATSFDWTNVDVESIGLSGTYVRELERMQKFFVSSVHFIIFSAKLRSVCFGINMLNLICDMNSWCDAKSRLSTSAPILTWNILC